VLEIYRKHTETNPEAYNCFVIGTLCNLVLLHTIHNQYNKAEKEIKEIWESIQRNKEAFRKQIDKWIEDGVAAIRDYADGKDNDFQPKQGNSVAWCIIAEAFRYGLDPTDEKQRRMAAAYLLEKVPWTGMSEFKAGLTASRTRQLCDAMMVPKDMMANLLLAAGGRNGISTGGGGSTNELTNWDGTKKKTGWGIG